MRVKESRKSGAAAVRRAAGSMFETCCRVTEWKEVSWEVAVGLAQTDASATGRGSPSLIAASWRPGTFAQPLRTRVSSYFPSVFCAKSSVFAANKRSEPSLVKVGEMKSRKSNRRHAP
jgi:hypothetical protein|eukprot:3178081-Prymnesium_polylepis.1